VGIIGAAEERASMAAELAATPTPAGSAQRH
jgi:hypothetical protein